MANMDFLSALLFAILLILTFIIGFVILAVAFTLIFAGVGLVHNKIKGVKLPEIKYKW